MMKFRQTVRKIPIDFGRTPKSRITQIRIIDYTDLECIEKICGIIFSNLCNQAEGVDKKNPFS